MLSQRGHENLGQGLWGTAELITIKSEGRGTSVLSQVLCVHVCGSSPAGSLLLGTGTLVSHVTLRLLKPECALDKSWCQEELSVAVKRAVTLLHSHTITSRVGKGEPGKDGTNDMRRYELTQGMRELPHPLGLPEAVAIGKSSFSLALVSSSEKWGGGAGPDGGFLSPVPVFCEWPQPQSGLTSCHWNLLVSLILTFWSWVVFGVGAGLALELGYQLSSLLAYYVLLGVRKGLHPFPLPACPEGGN